MRIGTDERGFISGFEVVDAEGVPIIEIDNYNDLVGTYNARAVLHNHERISNQGITCLLYTSPSPRDS